MTTGCLNDMDDVIYQGSTPIHGASEFMGQRQQHNATLLFFPDSSERSRQHAAADQHVVEVLK